MPATVERMLIVRSMTGREVNSSTPYLTYHAAAVVRVYHKLSSAFEVVSKGLPYYTGRAEDNNLLIYVSGHHLIESGKRRSRQRRQSKA